jgi:predicted alpha/beta hydrolase family esterase
LAELDTLLAELAQWAHDRAVPVEQVAYGDHPDQFVEWRGEGPAVLVLHGGFWRAAWDRSTSVPLAIALAQAGWRSANVEYRRLGHGRWREMLDDVAAAATLVRPDVAVGHSAGGHLALWLRDVPAVSLAGVCDLVRAAQLRLGDGAVQHFLGGEDPEAFAAAGVPLDPRNVVVHGTRDDIVPVELSRSYADRSGCALLELDDADHFDVIDPRYTRFGEIIDAVARARPRPR